MMAKKVKVAVNLNNLSEMGGRKDEMEMTIRNGKVCFVG
jgi:hypothetical protein